MSLSYCEKCWNTPCTCGWEYRNWTIRDLQDQIKVLKDIIKFKINNSNNSKTPVDDKIFWEYMKKKNLGE